MVVHLIVSALLLDFLGCTMPLAWIEGTRTFKAGVILIWFALIAIFITMGLQYSEKLMGLNPLLTLGLESICLICAACPLYGLTTHLAPCGTAQVNTVAVLSLMDLLVTAVGYISLLLGTVWLIFF